MLVVGLIDGGSDAREGVDDAVSEPVAGAFQGHERNAKLILEVVLRVDAFGAGIYGRAVVPRRLSVRAPIDGKFV